MNFLCQSGQHSAKVRAESPHRAAMLLFRTLPPNVDIGNNIHVIDMDSLEDYDISTIDIIEMMQLAYNREDAVFEVDRP